MHVVKDREVNAPNPGGVKILSTRLVREQFFRHRGFMYVKVLFHRAFFSQVVSFLLSVLRMLTI